jgi:hypothetical protein
MIGTPLQRPASLGSRDVVSDEEFRQREAAREAQEEFDTAEFVTDAVRCDPQRGGLGNTPDTCANGVSIGPPLYWQDRGKPNRQASLVVDPPDGRIPPLTPEAQRLATARAAARRGRGATDSWEDRSAWERCLTRGAIGFLPTGYNNGNRIIQAPGYVIILVEMIHEARVVPLKGSAHAGPGVRSYNGDSRGHWEGNTLVVETTNFTDRTNFRGSGENLRLVERFTRTDKDTLLYQFTVDDPESFARPWSGEIPMKKTDGPLFEYACHETNYSMTNMLSSARAEERH